MLFGQDLGRSTAEGTDQINLVTALLPCSPLVQSSQSFRCRVFVVEAYELTAL
jgi:hypothetical protein